MNDLVRLLGAALTAFLGISISVMLVMPLVGTPYAIVATPVLFFGNLFLVCWLFNRRENRWPYMQIEQMEAQGLIELTDFKARRAFEVTEYNDEGLHYFLELNDGSAMYLTGQHLYDYLAIDDDEEVNQERTFPCTDFSILRHKKTRYVVAIETRGEVFEPELVLPEFPRRAFRDKLIPHDGDIIRDQTYDELQVRFVALHSGAR